MFRRNFLFGEDALEAGGINVSPKDLYQPGKGYGFVIELNRREQELLQLTELNSGFEAIYWYQDKDLTKIQSDTCGCYVDSDGIITRLNTENEVTRDEEEEPRRIPLCFKCDVTKEGNYKVIVTIKAEEDIHDILIYTGRRRLAAKRDLLKAGEILKEEFLVNVCDIVPRGQTRIYQDKSIDITVVANKPYLSQVQVMDMSCPTIYIAGDSTVTDQKADYPYAPGSSYSGWGQMMTAYLDTQIAVSNHAHSGLTTESFRKEGHYAIVDQYSRPRDYFFIQFGHNDQKLDQLKAKEGYRLNILRYINECRNKGAFPLIVTPMGRNSWKGNDGTYNDLLKEYAEVCLEIGKTMDVPVLDLHKKSVNFIVEHGMEGSKAYFFPTDYTHSDDYGAYLMAGFVAQEILRTCSKSKVAAYKKLAEHVTEGLGEWIPDKKIKLPVKPKAYEDMVGPNGGQELFADLERPEESLIRADALDMVIKTCRFFPINVYNDMYEDVVGHEWYAGSVECAYQNGILIPEVCQGNLARPEKEVTMEEFLIFVMNGYKSRKVMPPDVPCVYDTKVRPAAVSLVRATAALGVIPNDNSVDMNRIITRKEAADICRALHI